MVVISALGTAGSAVKRNPILFVVVAAFGLFQVPGLVAQSIDPLLGSVVSLGVSGVLVLLMPFFFGGLIAMANEAIDGRTEVGTLLDAGKDNYLSILAVSLGLLAFYIVLWLFTIVTIAVSGAFAIGFGSGGGGVGFSPAVLVVVAVVGLFGLLVYFGVVFFVQFYAHAIVLDGVGAVDGVKRSVRAVRRNLSTVFGYNLITGIVGAGVGLLTGVISVLSNPSFTASPGATTPMSGVAESVPTIGTAGVVGLTLVVVLLSAGVGGLFAAYSTAVYRSIRPTA
ncbi:MAG: hypothetical protein U9O06_06780 [Euryarchaeota archaeon]|nr:hypothetical protein [Euryarchaeota archaeon]